MGGGWAGITTTWPGGGHQQPTDDDDDDDDFFPQYYYNTTIIPQGFYPPLNNELNKPLKLINDFDKCSI